MKKTTTLEMNRHSIDSYKSTPKIPLVVILDNVRSLHNVGAIFRTSDAFLIEKIYLCGITSTPPHAEIHKTALGAEFSVDWSYEEETTTLVEQLKADNYTIMALEQVHGSISMENIQLDSNRKYALILGNEVKGVQQCVVDLCDLCIEIPQYGTKHSLNVSVSGGIAIYQCATQLIKNTQQ